MSQSKESNTQRYIIYNAIRTPDKTVLVSRSRHDYIEYVDAITYKVYMIDGGTDYVHSSANGDEEYLTLYTDDDHSKIREVYTWGTYGKHGDQPLKHVALKDLSDNHIKAILETQSHLPEYMKDLFITEVNFRINEKGVKGELN